ncbi:Uncharacterised protein [Candidatus Gugararchaeum adminiculabundum]|nr:Uncharacterised protein [Candidatus Gugararchaeum adminiculabundum]
MHDLVSRPKSGERARFAFRMDQMAAEGKGASALIATEPLVDRVGGGKSEGAVSELEKRKEEAIRQLKKFAKEKGLLGKQIRERDWEDYAYDEKLKDRKEGGKLFAISTFRRIFGTFSEAVRQAGLIPVEARGGKKGKLSEEELERRREIIVDQIKWVYEKIGRMPGGDKFGKYAKELFREFGWSVTTGSISIYFEKWGDATAAAAEKYALKVAKKPKMNEREKKACIIELLKGYREKLGDIPTLKEWDRNKKELTGEFGWIPHSRTISDAFGGWPLAIKAAFPGEEPQRNVGGTNVYYDYY